MLTKDEIASFHEKGLLIADPQLDSALLDQIMDRVHSHYSEAFRANPVFAERVHDAWKLVDEVRQLAVQPVILSMLEQIWGRKPLPFQTLNFPIGTCQKPHSDTIHFNSNPKGFMAGVWVALEDIDESNGPLIYYPGSHLLPELTMQDLKLESGREHYVHYETAIENLIRDNGFEPELGTIPKGHIIIWHPNLLHGGHTHQDLSRSRHSQVTHYFFEGCEYYIPMLSEGKHQARLKHPEWIGNSPYRPPSFLMRAYRKLFHKDIGALKLAEPNAGR